ncbi:unnamed protein product [Penicillium glandicola]
MSNPSNQPVKEFELESRESQIRRRELTLDFERHELRIEHGKAKLERHELKIEHGKAQLEKQELGIEKRKAELTKQEIRTEQAKAELEKHKLKVELSEADLENREASLRRQITRLEKIETGAQSYGPDIIRLAISQKFRRGMIGTMESHLKWRGEINALQRCRYDRYVYEQELDEKEDRLANFLDVETRLREIAQRELCLMEQLEQDPVRIQQEISDGQKEYIRLEQEWWMIRNSFSTGSLERAFDHWRGNPRWYMHRVLREDCAGRGGCCGRGCGCCLNRKLDSTRRRAVGHCTVECGCCQKARGVVLSGDEKKEFSIRYAVSQDGKKDPSLDVQNLELKHLEIQNLELQQMNGKASMKDTMMEYECSESGVAEFERYLEGHDSTDDEAESTDDELTEGDEEHEDPYYRRISQVSIWGLVDGNFENPFDLIDAEPCSPTQKLDDRDEWPSSLIGYDDKEDSMMTETDCYLKDIQGVGI